jgi:hypothetical protein
MYPKEEGSDSCCRKISLPSQKVFLFVLNEDAFDVIASVLSCEEVPREEEKPEEPEEISRKEG